MDPGASVEDEAIRKAWRGTPHRARLIALRAAGRAYAAGDTALAVEILQFFETTLARKPHTDQWGRPIWLPAA